MVVLGVPRRPPQDLPGLREYERWTPDAQARALELLKETKRSSWRPFYCENTGCDGHPHGEWEWEHARADQRPPKWSGDWLTLWMSGGRGSGKTRTGAEITHRAAKATERIILVAPTGPDLRDTMVEGVSGILACSQPGNRPEWEPSKKRLTWPNGCIAQGFSAEEPDRLRGPQSGFIWGDEPAFWDRLEDCWDNMTFGLRMGRHPHIVATSTPLPTKAVKTIWAEDDTVVRRVSTFANIANLSDKFRQKVVSKYEGTRLGLQELHGEMLEDVEGALWTWDMFSHVDEAPELVRIVVAVDPAGTANARSDETGIIVLGIDAYGVIYVLADLTGKFSPAVWGAKVNAAYGDWSADAIVPEKNFGNDMVTFVLENAGYKGARIKPVQSRRGKQIRAEPAVALYEKRKVVHVGTHGELKDLEDEQTSWIPGKGPSPNRVDALVHGTTELSHGPASAEVASPTTVLAGRRFRS